MDLVTVELKCKHYKLPRGLNQKPAIVYTPHSTASWNKTYY